MNDIVFMKTSKTWFHFGPVLCCLLLRNTTTCEFVDHQMLLQISGCLRHHIVDGFHKEFHKNFSNCNPSAFTLESFGVLSHITSKFVSWNDPFRSEHPRVIAISFVHIIAKFNII